MKQLHTLRHPEHNQHVSAELRRLYTALAELAQQELVVLPCCGYADSSAIKWGSYTQVAQCHSCGQVYTIPPQRKQLSVPELEAMWNAQADHMNQWDELGLDEIVAFAQAAHGIKE